MQNKYGLIIRAPKSQSKIQSTRPAIPKPAGIFDDDDDDVEQEISRHATKNKTLKDVEEQHKKALEEDPSVFDYDGVYDDMKSKLAQPKVKERQQRESKYIALLKEKAKLRELEHEVVYERKLAKERSKDDHLYADKDKFVTQAYKRKLAEKEQLEKEEHARKLREEKDDVTKKSDLSDFYFSLSKNVAFGAANKTGEKKPEHQEKESGSIREQPGKSATHDDKPVSPSLHRDRPSSSPKIASRSKSEDRHQAEASDAPRKSAEPAHLPETSGKENPPVGDELPDNRVMQDHHKKSEDALAAAKERFLARKRAKVTEQYTF
ncbi:hypothetical protein vseg_010173 [Gypsophila vaccaria]